MRKGLSLSVLSATPKSASLGFPQQSPVEWVLTFPRRNAAEHPQHFLINEGGCQGGAMFVQ
jgi:hypothetical protein